ncbi:MAG: hypothetical protein HGA45_43430, partial [Chloroflexales bacterium]|nr:hypothetical protein [Chloroflexales bacterium]
CTVVNARFIKPLDDTLITDLLSRTAHVVTIEENALAGGFGSAVVELLLSSGAKSSVDSGLPGCRKRSGVPSARSRPVVWPPPARQREVRPSQASLARPGHWWPPPGWLSCQLAPCSARIPRRGSSPCTCAQTRLPAESCRSHPDLRAPAALLLSRPRHRAVYGQARPFLHPGRGTAG